VEAALAISNVQILCKKCGPTRIGLRMEKDDKVRFCKKCGGEL
jgi:large subunit ribosomal protein L24